MYSVITYLVFPNHKRMCCALYHILPWKQGLVLKGNVSEFGVCSGAEIP